MSRIEIRNIGPIKDVSFDLKRYNVFIGPQSSGKSTIAKIISYCAWLEKEIAVHPHRQKDLSVYENNFLSKLEEFHNMNSYFRGDSYLLYESDYVKVQVDGFVCSITLGKNIKSYRRRKVLYVPAERNIVTQPAGVIGENNINSFAFDWTSARDFYDNKNRLSLLDLNVDFYQEYKNGKTVNKVGSRLNGYDIELSDASSGLQALIPVATVVDFFTKRFYDSGIENRLLTSEQAKDRVTIKNYINDEYADKSDSFRERRIDNLTNTKRTSFVIEEPEQNLYPSTQLQLLDFIIRCSCVSNREHTITITTHSPYIVNYMNLLLKRFDKFGGKDKTKTAQIEFDELNVFAISDGQIRDLKVKNEGVHFIDTNSLSQQISGIYDEFDALDADI